MQRPGPRQGQQHSGYSTGTARPAVGTSACSGQLGSSKASVKHSTNLSLPKSWEAAFVQEESHFFKTGLERNGSVPSFLLMLSATSAFLCVSPEPPPASTPGRRPGLGPLQPQQDISREYSFRCYFHTLVLINHIDSVHQVLGSEKPHSPLSESPAQFLPALPSLQQSTQGIMALSQICPSVDMCN